MNILPVNSFNYDYDLPDLEDNFVLEEKDEIDIVQNSVPISDDGVSNEVKNTMRKEPIVIPLYTHRMSLIESFTKKNQDLIIDEEETKQCQISENREDSGHIIEWYEELLVGNKPNKEAEELTKQEQEFYKEFINNLEAIRNKK